MAPRLLLNVVKRLARHDPQAAAQIWSDPQTNQAVTEREQYDVRQQIAVNLALQQLPDAEDWFSGIPEQYLTDTAREWRVRAALRQAQWPLVLTALDALTPEQQSNDRWQYWRARVNEELGETAKAMALFSSLAQQRSYYGFLAADRLNLPYSIASHPHETSAGTLFEIGQQAAVQRAHEFVRLGRMIEARREWRSAMQQMDNEQRVDAAKLAQYWGWAPQSILTMASTDQRGDLGLRFPLLYQQQILNHSERADISPAWTYGVIRQESAFVQDARSAAGAMGLMQLMPSTAKYISRSMPKKYRGKSKLTQADTNLALGTRYLRKMLKRFSGQTVLATAAYNAGARQIMRWLPAEATVDAERWIESIPYRETREYVTSVLAFTVIYADLLGLEDERLSQHMADIPTRETL
jgi:soluble lytic murein transglycosylase